MSLLIAVVTCHKFESRANVQRRTWVKDAKWLGIDVKFFVGRREGVHTMQLRVLPEDTVQLDVSDDYGNLPLKVQAMCRWATIRGYDYVLKTDDDTFVRPGVLLEQIETYKGFDSLGHSNGLYNSGFGYVLSPRAVRAIADAEWDGDPPEDRWVGHVLSQNNLTHKDNPYFRLYVSGTGIRCREHCRPSNNHWRDCPLCAEMKHAASVVCPYDHPELIEEFYEKGF